MTARDWDDVQAVHLRAPFMLAQAVQPHMSADGWGRIVNIASTSALGHAERANYCAAKAGVIGLTRALAVELGPQGITVNAVAPGLVVTRMTEATAARNGRELQEHVAVAAANLPVRRAGRPHDVAAAVSFFAGEDAGFITGQTLYVSGGPAG
jgi:3-oxoacyl-[acyl-carrier protein] reductase